MRDSQATRDVLMVRPARFGANPQTLASNRFQYPLGGPGPEACRREAMHEFDGLVAALTSAGVHVVVVNDTEEPAKPDALFPNNWVSFHGDGTAVLYPMLAANRRIERRPAILRELSDRQGFDIRRIVDLTGHEASGRFLEGTGSLVLDRVGRVAYCCLSPRSDPQVLADFARRMDYEPVAFHATDAGGVPVYHTNVMMSVGRRFAAVCVEAIAPDSRARVLGKLAAGGREIMELDFGQVRRFAGNILELDTGPGSACVVLSSAALSVLAPAQRRTLERLELDLVDVPVPVIERMGGGSVRCMIAEIHLPRGLSADSGSPRDPAG